METIAIELNDIDRHFAAFIGREGADVSPWPPLLAALVSNAVGHGHICLHLAEIADRPLRVDGQPQRLPPLAELRQLLAGKTTVGPPGALRPLILDDGGRLYLYRYWQYERHLAQALLAKAAAPPPALDEQLLADGLARYFPGGGGQETDWQQVAALAALRKRFCVISGGPGTGKTSTVVKILALLLEQAQSQAKDQEPLLRIALAAPTGKSAVRLKEAISQMKENLDGRADLKAQIPEDVSTIHRLLGPKADSVRFRHHADNRLPHDVVIVDEASMVALPLLAKLAIALRDDARLILLGDRDQLASVEAGAALGDICGGPRQEPFSPAFVAALARLIGAQLPATTAAGVLPPLSDAMVVLKKNYRFQADSGIGALGSAVNAGQGDEAMALLQGGASAAIAWRGAPRPEGLKKALTETVVQGYGHCLSAATAEEALRRFDAFRILCALRQGPYGVAGLNALVEEILAAQGLIDPRQRWYRGRPVLITVNDYQLKLFNGDIGMVFPDPEADGNPRVYFPTADGGVRKVSPLRLPAHETVYAMTIHKSQGSEFKRVLVMLPGHDSEGLTRELIYTGITRARQAVEIWGEERVFVEAVARKVERHSGLREALWGA
jgi:exodeoxyribonuclease V alpha subunit